MTGARNPEIARFDVFANPDGAERKRIPFFVDVQSDRIRDIQTRVVVPLWRRDAVTDRLENLHPEFEVTGQRVVMDTPALGSLPTEVLKRAGVNWAADQLLIQDALDSLFGG